MNTDKHRLGRVTGIIAGAMAAFIAQGQTPVHFSMRELTGSDLNRTLTIEQLSGPLGYGTNIIYGGPIVVQPVNGQAQTNLYTSPFRVSFAGLSRSIIIAVPDTTNLVEASSIVTNGLLTVFHLSAGTNVAAGTNMAASVNDGIETINLVGDPSFNGTNVTNVIARALVPGSTITNALLYGTTALSGGSSANLAIDQQQIFGGGGPGGGGLRIVDGDLGGAAAIEAGTFYGNGAGISNTPQSGVAGLSADLSQRVSTNDARDLALAGKINFGGRVTFATPYGANGQDITRQTNQGPGDYIFQGLWDIMAPVRTNGVSGFRLMDQADANALFTVGYDNNTGNYDPIPRSYMATYVSSTNTSQQIGVSEYAHFPYVGGSGATLSALPVHGQEIWSRMPVPPMVFTTWNTVVSGTNNCNEAYVSNVVRNINLDGLVAACAAKGIPVMIDIDAGWHGARDGNGYQTWNTTIFPHGIPFLANYCHTNAGRYVQLQMHQYFSGRVSNNWFSVSGGGVVQTPSTVNLVGRDIYQFYTWGIDSLRIGDGAVEDANGSPGFSQLMTRQLSQELLYPGGFVPSQKSFTNLMSFSCFLVRQGQSLAHQGAAYEINQWLDDQGDQSWPNPGVAIDKAMFQGRLTWTNYAQFAGKGHYFSAVYPTEIEVINNDDWQAILAMGVMFPYGVLLYTNNPSTTLLQTLTNSTYLDIYADALQNPAFPIFDNGSGNTSAWCKPMQGGKFALLLGNQTGSSQTIAVNWNQIISPRNFMPMGTTTYPFAINSGQAYSVTEVWGPTAKGTFQGTFSDTIPAHTAGWYVFTPVTVQWVGARSLDLNGFLGQFTIGSEGPGPQFWVDGFSIASSAGNFAYPIPTWVTQATVTCKMQVSAVTAWTNTVYAFWSQSGANGRDFNQYNPSNIVSSANPSITDFTFTVSWPLTNANKWLQCGIGACSNSATRYFAGPFQFVYQ